MKRPILLLNLLLTAVLVAGGVELRRRWLEARSREAKVLAVQPVATATAEAPPPAGPSAKLQSAQYFEVAERFLFSRDRNPNVVVEKPPEPPPKVMPNFPGVYGVLDVGMGPTVYIAVDQNGQKGFRPGDKIGEFTLRGATQKDVTFEWEGKPFTKTLDELRPRQAESSQPAQPEMPRMNASLNDVPAAPPPKPPENVRPAPGADIGGGRKGCIPGDNSPDGTVVDGYKKVSRAYAFGPICYWEQGR